MHRQHLLWEHSNQISCNVLPALSLKPVQLLVFYISLILLSQQICNMSTFALIPSSQWNMQHFWCAVSSTAYIHIVNLHDFQLSTQAILNLLIAQPPGTPTGAMIPIPQYPLYTATAAEYGLHPVRDLEKLFAVHPVCPPCVIHTVQLASIPGTCEKKSLMLSLFLKNTTTNSEMLASSPAYFLCSNQCTQLSIFGFNNLPLMFVFQDDWLALGYFLLMPWFVFFLCCDHCCIAFFFLLHVFHGNKAVLSQSTPIYGLLHYLSEEVLTSILLLMSHHCHRYAA